MFEIFPPFDWNQLSIGLLLAAAIAGLAWRLKFLAPSGAAAALVLGAAVYTLGGLPAAILLVTFFVSSSLLTRLFSRKKRAAARAFSKGGQRDWAQVLANGGATLLVLAVAELDWLTFDIAWLAFAAALATATADTWATELGVLSPGQPQLITTGKRVPRGASGAISMAGSLAALGGSLLIAILAGVFGGALSLGFLAAVSLAGLLGSFFDSLLGATVQAIYYCPNCKKETEQHPQHSCGTATTLRRGWTWLDNDWVNFFSTVFGVLAALGAVQFLL